MNKRYLILYPFIIAILYFGCGPDSRHNQNMVTVTDMLGRKVKIPEKVNKVVCVRAGALRLLSYLDAADMVAGVEIIERSNTCPYNIANPEYSNLPVIGPQHGGDAELIAQTLPDVIFMTYTTTGDADKLQTQTGIPVIALNYGDITTHRKTFYTALSLMAGIIDKKPEADSLINSIETFIKDLDKRTSTVSQKTKHHIYAGGISFRGSHGIASTSPEYAPFEFNNVPNLPHDIKSSNNSLFIDKEQLIEWNPDKIFIDYAGWPIVKDELEESTLKETLDAVNNNEIYLLLPYNWYTTNFATVFVNAYYTGSVLFPEEFSDINFEKKANEIYHTFLQKDIYSDVVKTIGNPRKMELN